MWKEETYVPAESASSVLDSRMGSSEAEESTGRKGSTEAIVERALLAGLESQSQDTDSGQRTELKGLLKNDL